MQADIIQQAFTRLLRPLVRMLLASGVPWTQFAELTKQVYVEVAHGHATDRGRKPSAARLAALAGISRREVSRLQSQLEAAGSQADELKGPRIARILTAWHVEREFIDDDGKPRPLPEKGEQGSLQSLLRRFAPGRAFSAQKLELLAEGLVFQGEDGRFRVERRDFVFRQLDPEILLQMGAALEDHANTLAHNLSVERRSAPRFEGVAENDRIGAGSVEIFEKFVATRGLAWLREADDWLAANALPEEAAGEEAPVRVGVGIYMISDQSTSEIA